MLRMVRAMDPGSHLMMLVSGGASALAELPEPGHSLHSLQAENRQMLAKGLDIHAMNAHRKTMSQIKGGKLLAEFQGALVTTLAISDVEGDSLSVIGSGIGDAAEDARFSFDPHIVATNRIARGACAQSAETEFGLKVQVNDETLYDDIHALAPMIFDRLQRGPSGLYIWGGEPTVVLPPDPGQGGRNQALALLLSSELAGRYDIDILVAGTDGTDGPTNAAGGFADGQVWTDMAKPYLRAADSGRYLETREALFSSGPTGTNVMDLVIALKR
jgi:hydroxypyruvate reductase